MAIYVSPREEIKAFLESLGYTVEFAKKDSKTETVTVHSLESLAVHLSTVAQHCVNLVVVLGQAEKIDNVVSIFTKEKVYKIDIQIIEG